MYLDLNEDDGFPIGNTMTEAIGMGYSGGIFDWDLTGYLMDAEVPILDQSLCGWWYSNGVLDDMICTYSFERRQERTGVCSGDSGGPIVVPVPQSDGRVKHRQVGVVSWGAGYCGTHPDVHARVSKAMDWIKTTVCDDWQSEASFCDDNDTDNDDDDDDDGPCVNNSDWYIGTDTLKNCNWVGWNPARFCKLSGAAENCPLFCDRECRCVNNPGAPCAEFVAKETDKRCRRPLSAHCPEQCIERCY